MKKLNLWYLGYILSLILLAILYFTHLSKPFQIALSMVAASIFSVSHVNVIHFKMLKNDPDYQANVYDERNIMIKEKAGSLTNMLNMILLGLVTMFFIAFEYIIPAVIVGVMLFIQPFILILVTTHYEKKF